MRVITLATTFNLLLLGFNGVEGKSMRGRILYGEKATQKYPWLVYFEATQLADSDSDSFYSSSSSDSSYYDDGYETFACAGSILNSHWILTAAHCIMDVDTGVLDDPDSATIFVGSDKAGGGYRYQSEAIYAHPEYHPQNGGNDADIAMIKLKHGIPAKISATVNLPSPNENSVGETALILGWGDTESQEGSEDLLIANVTIIDNANCKTFGVAGDGGVVDDGNRKLCVEGGYPGHPVTGEGDSGGPVMKGDQSDLLSMVQIGIVSYGSELEEYKGSEETVTTYDVYTDVSKYLDWISDTMSQNS